MFRCFAVRLFLLAMNRSGSGGCFMAAGGMVGLKLLGAIGALEVMALAGNGKRGYGHK